MPTSTQTPLYTTSTQNVIRQTTNRTPQQLIIFFNHKCDPTNVYCRNILHTSTYIHALSDINQSVCIINYNSINLNGSWLDAWLSTWLGISSNGQGTTSTTSCENTQICWRQFIEHHTHRKINIENSGGFSPRFSTASRMGCGLRKTASTRRASTACCSLLNTPLGQIAEHVARAQR